MSSQALLKAIETTGQDELAHLERETRNEVKEILDQAQEEAKVRRKAAYEEALRPAAPERARRLHEAQMKALKITAAAHDEVTARLRTQIEEQLRNLRGQSQYRTILQHLVEEAVQTLGKQEIPHNSNPTTALPQLVVDARDEEMAQEILQELSIEMTIAPELTTWGGVIARSSDGRIIVTNTLEARLKKIEPYLGTFIPKNNK